MENWRAGVLERQLPPSTPSPDNSYQARALINTAALARCDDALSTGQLFQQFASGEKPLKTAHLSQLAFHWAKAAVLMRLGDQV